MLRVTQRTMYSTMVNQMNNSLASYMESQAQGSTLKKVNKPSDDPAGMARILKYRASIDRITQLESSSDTALGWLQLADTTLSNSVSTLLGSSILPLAEQAATDTYTAENRKQIAKQLREYMGTLINMANTRYEDKSIFAGQNYSGSAFVEGLSVTSANWGSDPTLDPTTDAEKIKQQESSPNPPFQVEGSLSTTVVVRFSGQANGGNPAVKLQQGTAYEYSLDGGKTWDKTGTVEARADGSFRIDIGDADVILPGTKIDKDPNTGEPLLPSQYTNVAQERYVKQADPDQTPGDKNGTMLYVRPTAIYQGSDNNASARIDPYGQVNFPQNITTSVDSNDNFTLNTLVKFENEVKSTDSTFDYKYSVDSGSTWLKGTATIVNGKARMILPEGHMDLNWNSSTDPIPAGSQLSVKPQRTDLSFTIMDGQSITVNNVGKDIFGGIYKANYGDVLQPAFGENNGQNLFETLGRLIGYCESNNCDGIGNCLADLKLSEKNVLLHATTIGGKENRLEATIQNLDDNKYAQQTRVSALEDVDITELMVRLTQQQMTYQTVLQSSSLIMNLSLANYIS